MYACESVCVFMYEREIERGSEREKLNLKKCALYKKQNNIAKNRDRNENHPTHTCPKAKALALYPPIAESSKSVIPDF